MVRGAGSAGGSATGLRLSSRQHPVPPGLNPKDYRSLKTQYLQVSLLGAPRRASMGQGIAACLLLAMGHHAAVLPRDVLAACRGWCEPGVLPAPQGALSSLLGLLPVPMEVAHCCLVCAGSQGSVLISVTPPQSYGPEHLLTFHNLKRIGLLTEQAAGETLTAVESRVSKLVTDRAAGESQSHGELWGRAAHCWAGGSPGAGAGSAAPSLPEPGACTATGPQLAAAAPRPGALSCFCLLFQGRSQTRLIPWPGRAISEP